MKDRTSGGRSGSVIWAAVLAVIFIAAAGSAFLLQRSNAAGTTARIYQKGVLIREIDLSAVKDPYDFTVVSENGMNTISVRSGGICVSDADCGDHTCMKQGWLESGVAPIVCLPHELMIRLEKGEGVPAEDEPDAVTG